MGFGCLRRGDGDVASYVKLVSGTGTGTPTSVALPSLAAASGNKLIAAIYTRQQQTTDHTISGGGLTWTKVGSQGSGTGSDGHTTVYEATATGAVSATFSWSTGSAYAAFVAEYQDAGSVGNTSTYSNTSTVSSLTHTHTTVTDDVLVVWAIGANVNWAIGAITSGGTGRLSITSGGTSAAKASISLYDELAGTAGGYNQAVSGGFHSDNRSVVNDIEEGGGGGEEGRPKSRYRRTNMTGNWHR